MSCGEFKADNVKLAPSKCLANESVLSQPLSKVEFYMGLHRIRVPLN